MEQRKRACVSVFVAEIETEIAFVRTRAKKERGSLVKVEKILGQNNVR